MKRVLIAVSILLILIGAVLFGIAFVAGGYDITKLGTVNAETNAYEVEDDFTTIEIVAGDSDIVILPAEDGKCGVICVEGEHTKHEVGVEKGTLKIVRSDQRKWYERIGLFAKSTSVTIKLPAAAYDALVIDAETGDVSLSGGLSFGNIHIKISTGEVRLSEVTCESLDTEGSTGDLSLDRVLVGGIMRIERSTGGVTLNRSDAGEIKITISTGDVEGTILSPKHFTVKTSTGSVKVPNTMTGGNCEITTSTGDVKIAIAE